MAAKSLARLAQQVGLGHLHLLEDHLALLVAGHGLEQRDLDAGGLGVHEKQRDALAVGVLAGGAGRNDHPVGDVCVGHEELDPVDHVALTFRLGLDGDERGVVLRRCRLGEGERHAQAALGDLGQELLLLRLAAGRQDRAAAQDDGGEVGAGQGRVAHLLHQGHHVEHAAADSAVFFGEEDPHPAELGHAVPERRREALFFLFHLEVPLHVRAGAGEEPARRLLEHFLVVGICKVHETNLLISGYRSISPWGAPGRGLR